MAAPRWVSCLTLASPKPKKRSNKAAKRSIEEKYHKTLVEKGKHKGQELGTNYPCTIVGIKQDGKILMISTTTQTDGSRAACKMKNMQELAVELGCYTAIMFDGGGSTQFVTLEGDNYVRRCSVSDGANEVRGVISGLALVYNKADKTVTNCDVKGTKFLDGLGLQSTFGEVEENVGGPHIEGAPSYSYYYVGDVSYINGKGIKAGDVIIALAPAIRPLLAENGIFVCSGIIDDRAEEVAGKLKEAGLVIRETHSSEGWFCYVCE